MKNLGQIFGWRIATVLALCSIPGAQASPADASAAPPFLPIEYIRLPLPQGIQPLWPIFSHDGRDILFQTPDGGVWMIGVDGSRLNCITCHLPDRPRPRNGGFVHAFPDGKRLLVTDGVASALDLPKGTNGWVVECKGGIRDCASPRVLPIDVSADRGTAPIAQRRTFHLSPDGRYIGWMNVRTDGTVMVVGRLERRTDRYVVVDPRAVNPAGPRSDRDDNADRWENLSQLYELKSFTPDGKAIIVVGTPNNNVDLMRVELADGRVTRLTAHTDWDEDSSLSPDQQLFVVGSWRGADRLDALAWIPQIRGFVGLMTGAAIAPYYVSTWEGFQCDLTPWLLPARGDDNGRLMGQPVAVYTDPTLTAANNVQGQRVWSPDSTMVLLHERLRTRDSAAPNRITIAKLDRAPTQPVTPTATQIGNWAVPAASYAGPHMKDRVVQVRGRAGGHATITYEGKLGGGGATTSVVFDRFTDDGATFITGTMSGAAAALGEGERRAWLLRADITVTGEHTGKLDMDLTLDNGAKPLPKMTGSMRAIYDGRTAPPLPALGPCYDAQPKPSPLHLTVRRAGRGIHAMVTADIRGDVRPVQGATVRVGAASGRTDASGRVILHTPHARGVNVVASAGDTFIPASAPLPPGR